MRFRARACAEIVGFMDHYPFNEPFVPWPGRAVQRDVLLINRDIAYIFQLNRVGHTRFPPAHSRPNRPNDYGEQENRQHSDQKHPKVARPAFFRLPTTFFLTPRIKPHQLQCYPSPFFHLMNGKSLFIHFTTDEVGKQPPNCELLRNTAGALAKMKAGQRHIYPYEIKLLSEIYRAPLSAPFP